MNIEVDILRNDPIMQEVLQDATIDLKYLREDCVEFQLIEGARFYKLERTIETDVDSKTLDYPNTYISLNGNFHSAFTGKLMSKRLAKHCKKERYYITLTKPGGKKRMFSVGRIMALFFTEVQPAFRHLTFKELDAYHLDGDPGNDRAYNVELVSKSESQQRFAKSAAGKAVHARGSKTKEREVFVTPFGSDEPVTRYDSAGAAEVALDANEGSVKNAANGNAKSFVNKDRTKRYSARYSDFVPEGRIFAYKTAQVSACGRWLKPRRGDWWKIVIEKGQYRQVTVARKIIRWHVLIAHAFNTKTGTALCNKAFALETRQAEGLTTLEVGHMDGDSSNNAAENLGFVTHQENEDMKEGTVPVFVHPSTEVLDAAIHTFVSSSAAERKYGLPKGVISQALGKGQTTYKNRKSGVEYTISRIN